MPAFKDFVRGALRRRGYRITRDLPPNRFQAMEETLGLLRDPGYAPRLVIDCGANVGAWTELVRPLFPAAEFHLVEPQPACAGVLRELAARTPGLVLHPVAVTRPGVDRVRLVGGGPDGRGTGAFVALPGEASGNGEVECPAATLDALLGERVTRDDRALLKLDLEGHELAALEGAARLLGTVEVVLTEVQFYEINGNGRPVFADVVAFLRERGFEVYDFACLSQRPRDMRLRMGDVVFVRRDSPLLAECSWE